MLIRQLYLIYTVIGQLNVIILCIKSEVGGLVVWTIFRIQASKSPDLQVSIESIETSRLIFRIPETIASNISKLEVCRISNPMIPRINRTKRAIIIYINIYIMKPKHTHYTYTHTHDCFKLQICQVCLTLLKEFLKFYMHTYLYIFSQYSYMYSTNINIYCL